MAHGPLWHAEPMDAADPTQTTPSKRELRAMLRAERRRRYGDDEGAVRRAAEGEALVRHAAPLLGLVTASLAATGAARVAAYHPTPTEADVMPLATTLAALGAQVVFPAAAGEELEWITWDGHSPFLPSPGKGFGREPEGERLGPHALERAVLVLAPAVAVDRTGTRIGHGAGYYDRALPHRPDETPVIAVIHPSELLASGSLPREEHDVPIDAVLTAEGLHVILDHPALRGAARS